MVATKHLCPTCGYKIKRPAKNQSQEKEIEPTGLSQNFWSKLIKWDFASSVPEKSDSNKEKPVVLS